MASGISSVAMLSIFVSLPVSIPLDGISLTGASVSGMAMVLTEKYQKKLAKVMKLVDIVTSALAVFKTNVSKVLNDGKVHEHEFGMFQMFHLGSLNNLAGVDHKMEAETRTQLEEINDLKKAVSSAS